MSCTQHSTQGSEYESKKQTRKALSSKSTQTCRTSATFDSTTEHTHCNRLTSWKALKSQTTTNTHNIFSKAPQRALYIKRQAGRLVRPVPLLTALRAVRSDILNIHQQTRQKLRALSNNYMLCAISTKTCIKHIATLPNTWYNKQELKKGLVQNV